MEQLGPNGDQSSRDPQKVDVLVPCPPKEYVDPSRSFVGQPDYRFTIRDMSTLTTQETELLGQVFHLPCSGHDAQLKCCVTFSYIQLYLELSSESTSGMPTKLPHKLLAVVKQRHPADDIFLTCQIEHNRRFGLFYHFCSFTFADRMKNGDDSLLIHLYVQNAWEEIDTQGLRWKVDFSNVDITTELGLTPIFYADPRGFRIQARLFLRRDKVLADVTIIKAFCEGKSNFLIKLIAIHPMNQRLNIARSINFGEWYTPEEKKKREFMHKFSTVFEIANVEQLRPFLLNNKLMVNVMLFYV